MMRLVNTPPLIGSNRLNHKRILWLDAAKGVCMIMVIYGHACQDFTLVNRWICSFFMGLFFISGGYTYRYKEGWAMQNFMAILVPYYLWAIAGLLFVCAKNIFVADLTVTQLWQKALRAIAGVSSDNYPLWFLAAYFVSKSVYDLINLCVNSKVCRSRCHSPVVAEIAAVLLIAAAGYLYAVSKPLGHSVFRFDTGLIMLPLFAVGRYTPVLLDKIDGKNLNLLAFIVFIAINLVTGLALNQLVSVNSNEYGNIFWFYISTVSGTWSIFIVCKMVCRVEWLRALPVYFGANSIIILCCHYFFLFFIAVVSIGFFRGLREYPILITALCVALMLPAVAWLRKLTDAVKNLTVVARKQAK